MRERGSEGVRERGGEGAREGGSEGGMGRGRIGLDSGIKKTQITGMAGCLCFFCVWRSGADQIPARWLLDFRLAMQYIYLAAAISSCQYEQY